MRVLVLHRGDAAAYYRQIAPLTVLRYRTEHEFTFSQQPWAVSGDYDVMWLQQHSDSMTLVAAMEFHDNGGRVIYDVDDDLSSTPPSWPCYDEYFDRGTGSPTLRMANRERFLRLADIVTTTTPRLASALAGRLPGKPIRVLPNCVLRGDWDTVPRVAHDLDGPVLGWFGTGNHWDDWSEIAPAVEDALQEVNGVLALIGAPEVVTLFSERLAARTQIVPLVPMQQFHSVRRLIRAFDVGLAWCTDRTVASVCRSPLKALQYGAAGVPVVASEVVYGYFKLGQHDGLVTDWQDSLAKRLIEMLSLSRDERQALGRAWQDVVWREHTYEQEAMRWLDVLHEVMDGPADD